MVEPVALSGGVGVQLQDRAAEFPEGMLVHHDRNPGRFESMTLVRSVFLDGNAEAGSAAAEQMPDAQDGVREVGLRPQARGGFRRDGERRSVVGGHGRIV